MKATVVCLLLSLFAFAPCAHAYIDPGSGSFLLQMLLASLIGGMLTIKLYFNSFKAKLKSLFCSTQKCQNQSQGKTEVPPKNNP